jgi:hypothetical protein
VVVQAAGEPPRRIAVPKGVTARVLDVDTTGSVLVRTGDTVTAFEAGATQFSTGVSISAESGCTMTDAVVIFGNRQSRTFTGISLWGFERCATGVRMFNNSDGTAHPNGRTSEADQVLSMSLGPGGVLVSYRAVPGGPVVVATYNGNAPQAAGFGPALVYDGSVRSPSW